VLRANSLPRGRTARAFDRHQLSWRLLRHHLWIGLLAVGVTVAMAAYLSDDVDPKHRLSTATAYAGLLLLAVTLLLGPLKVFRRVSRPLSDDLRRDFGIWAAIVGVVHTLVGSIVHLGGTVLPYFFYIAGQYDPAQLPGFWPLPFRIDPFGIANYTGLLAALLLVLLLALSNDVSMRWLGGRRWKRLQQLSYAIVGLVIVHGILYQRLEDRPRTLVLLFAAMAALIVVGQVLGAWHRSRRSPDSVSASEYISA
jgi:sulfoxide reductase heme-binding subunit YedZ